MELVAKIDEYGKPAWIGLTILGFLAFWPIGLALLVYLIWSGRMGCAKHGGPGRWWHTESSKKSRRKGNGRPASRSSGNLAFDEYREETLRRLEDEQEQFSAFLDNLRMAKDKAEFDQFMKQRKDKATESAKDKSDDKDDPEASKEA